MFTQLSTQSFLQVPAIDNLNTFAPVTTTTIDPTFPIRIPCHNSIAFSNRPLSETSKAKSDLLQKQYQTLLVIEPLQFSQMHTQSQYYHS
jgi:hypothetical protein